MRPLDPEVLPHLLPARRPLAVVVGAGLAGGLLTVAQAWAIGSLVVRLVSDPVGEEWHGAALALLAVVGLRTLVEHVATLASARAAARVSTTLRHRLLAAATARPGPPGPDPDDLVLLATRGATSVEPYVTRYLPAMVLAATLPPLTVATIWWLDWLSGLIVLLTLPLVPVFAALVGMTTRDRAARQWRELGVLSGHFLDVVRGLPTLVAHRRAEAQVARIGAVTERYRRATVDTLRLAFASSSVLELVATLSVALVAVCVGLRLANDTIGFETALVVLLLAPEAYWPLRRVGAEFHAAAEGTAALTEATAALGRLEAGERGQRVPDSPGLRLDGLTPGHPGSPRALTHPLALDLPDRGLVAVVGPSGCGKSTLLQTLRGELAAYGGRVLVGGVDLADVDPDWWHRQVAWLPQRPWLAAGTVRDNLRLGRPDASDATLWRALAAVGMDDVVTGHRDGLDRLLGEDGAGLSAGQRARLAMARVLVADRPVVLLDEPTAHLDAATEQVLLAAVQTLAEHSLVVVVAHREAVLAAADRVVELVPVTAEAPAAVTVTVPPARAVAAEPDDVPPPGAWAGPLATVLGVLSTASGVALTATAAWLITRASAHPPVLVLMVAIVGVRTFGIARPVLRHAERLLSHDVALHELAARRTAVYAALVPLVPGALRVAGPRRGDLLASVVDDVDSLLDARLRVRQPIVTALAVGLLAAGLAWWWAPPAGAVVAALVAAGVLAALLGRNGARVAEPAHLRHRARVSTLAEEVVAARDELRQWQAAPAALAAVDAEGDALERAVRRSVRAVGAGHAAVRLATGAAVVGIAAAVPADAVSPATLALLVLLPVALGEVLAPLADAGALSVRTDAARLRLDRLAALAPLVADPADPAPLPPGATPMTLEGVSAGWGPEPCLRDLALVLRPGERVAVCGPSGSGKSTLASLLVRHLDPSAGSVRLGGVDLRDAALDDVRHHVGLAADDPHVFASSVCENVRLARPGATDAEVADALGRARLGAWVESLPQGMHTLVGSAGIAVSGGERARIAVARALLADAPVLVLDEPTAHLDTATAREVADVLLGARADRAVVWVTHGTVGLDRVDRVLALGLPEVSEAREPRVAAPA